MKTGLGWQSISISCPWRRLRDMMSDRVFYGINGATALREGVSFTVCSMEATDVELLLYHRGERKPYAVLPFPKALPDRKGLFHVCFRTDIYDFEYAYRVNGPYDPQKGLIFDKKKPLLDPYARAVTGQSVGVNSPIWIMSTGRGW